MIKIMLRSNYDDMVNYQVEILKENAELRKVCQCRECKWNWDVLDDIQVLYTMCANKISDNYGEVMNPYGSCEKCERR